MVSDARHHRSWWIAIPCLLALLLTVAPAVADECSLGIPAGGPAWLVEQVPQFSEDGCELLDLQTEKSLLRISYRPPQGEPLGVVLRPTGCADAKGIGFGALSLEGLDELGSPCPAAATALRGSLEKAESSRRLVRRGGRSAADLSPELQESVEAAGGWMMEPGPGPERAALLGFLQPTDLPPLLWLGGIALLSLGLGVFLSRRASRSGPPDLTPPA